MSDTNFFGDLVPQQPVAAAQPQQPGPSNNTNFFGDLAPGALQQEQPTAAADNGPAPDWSQIPGMAASNFGESGKQFLGNMAQAVMHPIESAENVGKVGLGYMEKAGRHAGLPSGQGYEKYADAVNQMVMDRYGGMDNFKRTLAHDPVGVLADASAVLTGGEGLAGRIPGVVGEVARAAGKVGSFIDPLNPIAIPAKYALKGAGTAAKEVLGVKTGVGPEPISRAVEAGRDGGSAAEEFRSNMRGNVPVEGVVDDAMGAIENIVSNKNSEYKAGMAQAGLNQPISQSSMQKINNGITNAISVGNLQGYQYSKSALKANSDLRDIVDAFFDPSNAHIHTVEGLDALKQEIGEYQRTNNLTGKASIVGNEYYHAVKNAIVDQAPKYAKVMDDYSEAKDLLSQLKNSFSLPTEERKLNVDSALRKLQSLMRNNVNTSYGYRQTLAQHLKNNGAPNIDYALAGQALNSGSPRGLARVSHSFGAEIATELLGLGLGHPLLGAAGGIGVAGLKAFARSPRAVGEAAYYTGRAGKPLSKVVNRPVARALNQAGRLDNMNAINIHPVEEQSRGGAIGRAKRLAMRKH